MASVSSWAPSCDTILPGCLLYPVRDFPTSRSLCPTHRPTSICGSRARYGWKNVNVKAGYFFFCMHSPNETQSTYSNLLGEFSQLYGNPGKIHSQRGRKCFSKGLLPINSLFFFIQEAGHFAGQNLSFFLIRQVNHNTLEKHLVEKVFLKILVRYWGWDEIQREMNSFPKSPVKGWCI